MNYKEILAKLTKAPAPSGQEERSAGIIADYFKKYTENITIDALHNVIAETRSTVASPHIVVMAHHDEIGMMTTFVEDDGAVRFARMGGMDNRPLPGSRVWVHALGDDGQTVGEPLLGVIGALPPHLLTASDREKYYKMDDLFIDLGLPADEVKRRVPVGAMVTLDGPPVMLSNNKIASKTLDDRLGVAVMLRTAEILSTRNVSARVTYVATGQEETTGYGARTAAYKLNADIGIALDMTFGKQGAKDDPEYSAMDEVTLLMGPLLHPLLSQLVADVAKEQHVSLRKEFAASRTYTDADDIQISNAGVPTALLLIPAANMHSAVETASLDTAEETARLLSAFIEKAAARWKSTKGDWLCRWDD